MKNLLILIVAAAVYLHFFPEPELNAWFEQQKQSALTGFNNATDTKVRLNTKTVYKDLKVQFKHFSKEEIEYIDELTAERESVISFYFDHCDPYKQNFRFQSKNQSRVCKVIEKYRSFF